MIRQTAAVGIVGVVATTALVVLIGGATASIAATGTVGYTTVLGADTVEENQVSDTRELRQETRTLRLLTATGTGENLTIHAVNQTLDGDVLINTETPAKRVAHPGGVVVEHRVGAPSVISTQSPYTTADTTVLPLRESRSTDTRGPQQKLAHTYQANGTHLAVETTDVARWQPYFDAANMTVVATEVRFPGDAATSVVVALPPGQDVQLYIHTGTGETHP